MCDQQAAGIVFCWAFSWGGICLEASVLEDFLDKCLPLNDCNTKFFLVMICDFFGGFFSDQVV